VLSAADGGIVAFGFAVFAAADRARFAGWGVEPTTTDRAHGPIGIVVPAAADRAREAGRGAVLPAGDRRVQRGGDVVGAAGNNGGVFWAASARVEDLYKGRGRGASMPRVRGGYLYPCPN
jgi:hypothetical protein